MNKLGSFVELRVPIKGCGTCRMK